MTKKEYNGWTNYETWNVKLWMDNDQGSQEFWLEQAAEALKQAEADSTFTKEEKAALLLMVTIKDSYEETAQDVLEAGKVQCSWVADLLNAALSEVNWHEIAASLIDAAKAATEA